MTTVGYARVSSVGQSLDVQLEKLKGCERVFKEKRSGIDTGRPALKQCLEYLRDGDTLWSPRLIAWPVRPQTSIASFPSSPRRASVQGSG